jgi:hypothetical protein
MNPHLKDIGSTAAGSLSAAGILATVRWEAVPFGECVKIGLALILLFMSYRAYNGPKDGTPA